MRYRNYIAPLFACIFLTIAQSSHAQTSTLTLEECKRLALEQNKKIKTAQQHIEAAQEVRKGANSNSKPTIDGSVSGLYAGKPLNALLPEISATAMLSVTQPIYAGGKIKLGKDLASKAVEINEAQKVLTEAEVLLQVEKGYWQVVSVREKITLAETYKTMLEGLLKELTNTFDAGLIYKNDVLRVKVQLNETELNLAKAKDGLVLAKLSLAQVMGMPGQTAFAVQDSVTGTFTSVTSFSSDFTTQRPEINLLQKALEAEQLQEKLLKADFKPTAGLSAGGFTGTGKAMNFTNGKNFLSSYYGLVSLNIPIWDWGHRASKVREQSYKIAAKQIELEETKEFLSLEVQNAWLQLNQSVKRINYSTTSLEQADENLRLSNDRFKAGTVTGKDVLEAQALWQQAYTNRIDAKIEYKINEASYKKAIGDLR